MSSPEEDIRALEPIFHRSPVGSSREVFEAMTDESFFEVGASGRVYKREFIIDEVSRRYASNEVDGPLDVSEFRVTSIAEAVWLATYRLNQEGRVSRRATLWSATPAGWVALFHQGTLVDGDDVS